MKYLGAINMLLPQSDSVKLDLLQPLGLWENSLLKHRLFPPEMQILNSGHRFTAWQLDAEAGWVSKQCQAFWSVMLPVWIVLVPLCSYGVVVHRKCALGVVFFFSSSDG